MTTENKIMKIIATHTGAALHQIKNSDELVANLGCDSLDIVELMMALEEEFAINIDDDAFMQIKTVQQVIDHVSMLEGAEA